MNCFGLVTASEVKAPGPDAAPVAGDKPLDRVGADPLLESEQIHLGASTASLPRANTEPRARASETNLVAPREVGRVAKDGVTSVADVAAMARPERVHSAADVRVRIHMPACRSSADQECQRHQKQGEQGE